MSRHGFSLSARFLHIGREQIPSSQDPDLHAVLLQESAMHAVAVGHTGVRNCSGSLAVTEGKESLTRDDKSQSSVPSPYPSMCRPLADRD